MDAVGPPFGEGGIVDQEVEPACANVDPNTVAGLHESDRPPGLGLRCDVADTQTGRTTGETAVGDQQDVLAEPGSLDRRSDLEHLPHPRAADRSLRADDHYVALFDAMAEERLQCRLLTFELAVLNSAISD